MNEGYGACVILIDEAESLEMIEGALTFLREVFQRTSTDANHMVVLAGKLSFPNRMSESFSPLDRFFPTSILSPLKTVEIRDYLQRQLSREGIEMDDKAVSYLKEKSGGTHMYLWRWPT